MVGKNNIQEKFSRRANKNKRYTLKKLSVGVASVALGTVLLVNNTDSVSAQTEDDAVRQAEAIIDQVEPTAKEIESLLDQANAEGRSLTPEERQKIKEAAPQLLSAVEELEGIQDQLPKETIQDIEEDIAPEMEDVEQGIQEQEADDAQKQAEKAADEGFEIGKRIEDLLAKENKTAEDKKEIAKLAQELVAKGETIEGLQEQLPDDVQAQIDEDLATVEEETEQNLKETDAYTQAEKAADEGFEIGKRIEELLAKENKTAEDKKEIAKLAQELFAKGKTIEGLQEQLPDDVQAQIDEDLATVEEETEQNLKETDAYDHAKQLADEGFKIGKQIEALSNKESLTPDEKMELENLKEELKKKGKEIENIKHLLPQHIQKQIEEDLAAAETEKETESTPSEERTFENVRKELFELISQRHEIYNKLGTDDNGQKVTTPAEYAEMKTIVDAIKQTFDELDRIAQTDSELKEKVKSLKGAVIQGETSIPPLKQEPKETEDTESNQSEKQVDEITKQADQIMSEIDQLFDGVAQDEEGNPVLTAKDNATYEELIKKLEREISTIEPQLADLSEANKEAATEKLNKYKEEIKDASFSFKVNNVQKKLVELGEFYDGLNADNELTPTDLNTLEMHIDTLEQAVTEIEAELPQIDEVRQAHLNELINNAKEEINVGRLQLRSAKIIDAVEEKWAKIDELYKSLQDIDNENYNATFTPDQLEQLRTLISDLGEELTKAEEAIKELPETYKQVIEAELAPYKAELLAGKNQLDYVNTIKQAEDIMASIEALFENLSVVDGEPVVSAEEQATFAKLIDELSDEIKKIEAELPTFSEEVAENVRQKLATYKQEIKDAQEQLKAIPFTAKPTENLLNKQYERGELPSKTYNAEIPFKVEEREDSTLPKGERKVIQQGANGTKKVIEYYFPEVDEPVVYEEILEQPTNEIVLVGTKESESQDDVNQPSDIYFTEIPYKVEEREDNTLNKGERKVIQSGVVGLKKVTEFNQPGADEPEKHEEIIKQPTNEIILVGTKESESQDDVNQPSDIYFTEIPYKVEEREDKTLNKGERKVIQPGVTGLKKVTEFNQPGADEPEKHEEIIKQPTNEIILVGTKESESQDDVNQPSDIYFTEIPYKVEEREDKTLNKGERKVIQPGVTGLKKVTEFNQPGADEPEKHEEIIKQPTNEIVLVGTKEVTPSEKKDNFDAQLHKNLIQTELGTNRNDSIANGVQSDVATRDDFKAEFLAAYKERTIEELKAKGVTNKFVFNIIQRANTVEGIDSVVAELNSSVKEKTPEKGNGNQAPDKGQQAPQSAKGLSTIAEAKPAFPQAELDKLVAEERAKREAEIQTLPNLTQAQKDQFVANLKKASTVDKFDAILGEAKALTATQPEKAEQSEKQVDKKQEEKKADKKQGERLPDTATGAWALGLVGASSILAGAGIKKIKE
ncbi:G5 domain-containing protein [Dolosigranulum pigrum]|uniref:G5 domain-containing protein n=1 Tax=Dolosigranulum pigrum TaxID=29394 RepID=UPI001AD85B9F|nr:G5 domain-containing protein [Dolosigranulum pigrum]